MDIKEIHSFRDFVIKLALAATQSKLKCWLHQGTKLQFLYYAEV